MSVNGGGARRSRAEGLLFSNKGHCRKPFVGDKLFTLIASVQY